MSGIFIKLNNTYFQHGTTVSRAGDPVITDGSLLLVEPARDSLVTIGSALKNYAEVKAADLGIGGNTDLSVTDTLGTLGIMEKTAKGGLHGIVTSGAITTDNQLILRQPGVMQYLSDNPDHDFCMFSILRITRDAETFPGEDYPNPVLVGSIVPAFQFFQSSSTKNIGAQPGAATRFGFTDVESIGGDGRLVGIGSQLSGTSASGSLGGWGGAVRRTGGQPSYILYRLYIEDLTVSGRTFEEVEAIESAILASRFAPGGRYDGDTFTDPSSVSF